MSYNSSLGYVANPRVQFVDRDGRPLSGGSVEVYVAGTTTPYVTYRDWNGTQNETVITLDDTGSCTIISDRSMLLKLAVYTRSGALFATYDNVAVGGSGEGSPAGSGVGAITSVDGSVIVTRTYQDGVQIVDLSVTPREAAMPAYSSANSHVVTGAARHSEIVLSSGSGTWEAEDGWFTAKSVCMADLSVDAAVISRSPNEATAYLAYRLNGATELVPGVGETVDNANTLAGVHFTVKVPMAEGDRVQFVLVIDQDTATEQTVSYSYYLTADNAGGVAGPRGEKGEKGDAGAGIEPGTGLFRDGDTINVDFDTVQERLEQGLVTIEE